MGGLGLVGYVEWGEKNTWDGKMENNFNCDYFKSQA